RHGVAETLSGHVAVAAIARRRPREPLLNEVLPQRVILHAEHRSVRSTVGYETMRVQDQLPVPRLGDFDPVQAAVVATEEGLRAGKRLERGVAVLPLLRWARHGRDAGLPH